MLTQRQTWLHLAGVFDRTTDPLTCRGICHQLSLLAKEGHISSRTENLVYRRITRSNLVSPGMYFWPLNTSGTKRRAAWCRRQARRFKG